MPRRRVGKIARRLRVGHQGVYARLSTGYGTHDFAHADGRSHAPLPTLRV
jgi:hypothetical protein